MYQLVVVIATFVVAIAFLRSRRNYLAKLLLVLLGASCMVLVDAMLAGLMGENALEPSVGSVTLGLTLVGTAFVIAWMLPPRDVR